MKYGKLLWELYQLKKNSRITSEEMKDLQNKKLRAMLHYAWEHSDFYRRSYKKAGISENELDTLPLSAFPSIDKSILMEHFDELVTVSQLRQEDLRKFDADVEASRKPYLDKYHVVHSSGSTGTPCYFLYDEAAWGQDASGHYPGSFVEYEYAANSAAALEQTQDTLYRRNGWALWWSYGGGRWH